MKKMKLNNLLVKNKKYALIAILMFLLGIQKVSAYDERAYMTQEERYDYENYGVLPEDIEESRAASDTLGILFCGTLLTVGIIAGGLYLFEQRKGLNKKQKQIQR